MYPIVNFLHPTEIAGLGPRYTGGHPGPYAIEDRELNMIFPGIDGIRPEPYIERHVKGGCGSAEFEASCQGCWISQT